jgi:hypothetical protein
MAKHQNLMDQMTVGGAYSSNIQFNYYQLRLFSEIISFTNLNRSSEAHEVTESFSPALYANNRNHPKNIAINKISNNLFFMLSL